MIYSYNKQIQRFLKSNAYNQKFDEFLVYNGDFQNGNMINDPTYLGFFVEFLGEEYIDLDLTHYGKFMGDTKTMTPYSCLLLDTKNINSSSNYLNRIGRKTQSENIWKFAEHLGQIQTHMPWLFQSVTGLDEVLKIHTSTDMAVRSAHYGTTGHTITIGCLETVDGKMNRLASLYRQATWDTEFRRVLLPHGKRNFNMKFYLYDFRNLFSAFNTSGEPTTKSSKTDFSVNTEEALNNPNPRVVDPFAQLKDIGVETFNKSELGQKYEALRGTFLVGATKFADFAGLGADLGGLYANFPTTDKNWNNASQVWMRNNRRPDPIDHEGIKNINKYLKIFEVTLFGCEFIFDDFSSYSSLSQDKSDQEKFSFKIKFEDSRLIQRYGLYNEILSEYDLIAGALESTSYNFTTDVKNAYDEDRVTKIMQLNKGVTLDKMYAERKNAQLGNEEMAYFGENVVHNSLQAKAAHYGGGVLSKVLDMAKGPIEQTAINELNKIAGRNEGLVNGLMGIGIGLNETVSSALKGELPNPDTFDFILGRQKPKTETSGNSHTDIHNYFVLPKNPRIFPREQLNESQSPIDPLSASGSPILGDSTLKVFIPQNDLAAGNIMETFKDENKHLNSKIKDSNVLSFNSNSVNFKQGETEQNPLQSSTASPNTTINGNLGMSSIGGTIDESSVKGSLDNTLNKGNRTKNIAKARMAPYSELTDKYKKGNDIKGVDYIDEKTKRDLKISEIGKYSTKVNKGHNNPDLFNKYTKSDSVNPDLFNKYTKSDSVNPDLFNKYTKSDSVNPDLFNKYKPTKSENPDLFDNHTDIKSVNPDLFNKYSATNIKNEIELKGKEPNANINKTVTLKENNPNGNIKGIDLKPTKINSDVPSVIDFSKTNINSNITGNVDLNPTKGNSTLNKQLDLNPNYKNSPVNKIDYKPNTTENKGLTEIELNKAKIKQSTPDNIKFETNRKLSGVEKIDYRSTNTEKTKLDNIKFDSNSKNNSKLFDVNLKSFDKGKESVMNIDYNSSNNKHQSMEKNATLGNTKVNNSIVKDVNLNKNSINVKQTLQNGSDFQCVDEEVLNNSLKYLNSFGRIDV